MAIFTKKRGCLFETASFILFKVLQLPKVAISEHFTGNHVETLVEAQSLI
jgi:hypothetical protein